MLIDTHCHLDAAEFADDREAVHASARAAGVKGFVVPAVSRDRFVQTRQTVREYVGCVAAYGIHPLYVMEAELGDLDVLGSWLALEQTVAVGEIGLDFHVDHVDPARQAVFFEAQLRLARELGLPVLLHVRRAVDAVLQALRRTRVVGGIAHAFNGSEPQARMLIDLGFKLGFGGAMTYPGSSRIRRLAASLPLEAIVLETDAPDIPPVWLNRGRNVPGELPRIAGVLAELRGMTLADVAAVTSANAQAVLPRLHRIAANLI